MLVSVCAYATNRVAGIVAIGSCRITAAAGRGKTARTLTPTPVRRGLRAGNYHGMSRQMLGRQQSWYGASRDSDVFHYPRERSKHTEWNPKFGKAKSWMPRFLQYPCTQQTAGVVPTGSRGALRRLPLAGSAPAPRAGVSTRCSRREARGRGRHAAQRPAVLRAWKRPYPDGP